MVKRVEEERLRPGVVGFLAELVAQCSEFDAANRCGFGHVVEQLSSPELRHEATRMPLATRMPGPAIPQTQEAAVRASVDSEIEVVAQGSEAGPSSLHEKTLPRPGEAVHAASQPARGRGLADDASSPSTCGGPRPTLGPATCSRF